MLDSECENKKCVGHARERRSDDICVDKPKALISEYIPIISKIVAILTNKTPP